ncbi:hypothetical protein Ngar_c14080 [Candidatus Nitrososphaera gargensis Ga9.2]|uniref:Uncharacterized protein n=1 Tax=Nitrososphaera gargensis (strain Ga9.2) TaxID=1237085 RepID=K0IMW7_NITGG|nr:hypothetical protein [Candidatus Nitrososphaera gargensis]AFU58344.1 hypothetical protein Ngar_c14080 [Candidatus Nitrososphaera gargensis Ga9.2]
MDPEKERTAEQIISHEVDAIASNSARIKENSCAACHVLFTLVGRMNLSETDAADLLTEVLLVKPELNDRFIEMVENVHMKQRMMGVTFAIKTREAKDRYIDSQFKNTLDELLADTANYGAGIVLRKLVMSYIALEMAQNIGIDYHAATEELYYYMRKRDEETHTALMKLVRSMIEKRSRYNR